MNIGSVKANLVISPNPVTNNVQLLTKGMSQQLALRVTSADGRQLLSCDGTPDRINAALNSKLSSFQPGLYLVELTDGAVTYVGKMVKK